MHTCVALVMVCSHQAADDHHSISPMNQPSDAHSSHTTEQLHIFLAFYVFSTSIDNGDLYASFGFSSRPTLMGLFLFFQSIWAPIDKVRHPIQLRLARRGI